MTDDVVEARGAGILAVRLGCPADRVSLAANMWARRITAALASSFEGRLPVRWWEETRAPRCVWIDVGPEGGLVARVRLRRDPARADGLLIDSTTEGLPPTQTVLAPLAKALTLLGGVAGLLLWVWVLVQDRERVWNRLSGATSGDRANKVEIYLLAIGWLLGPVAVIVPVAAIMRLLELPFEGRAARKRVDFLRKEIDPVLDASVREACQAAQTDMKTRVDLGLGPLA